MSSGASKIELSSEKTEESSNRRKEYDARVNQEWALLEFYNKWLQIDANQKVLCTSCKVSLTINDGKQDLDKHAQTKKQKANGSSLQSKRNTPENMDEPSTSGYSRVLENEKIK